MKVFGWFIFLVGAVFIANSFFSLTDYFSSNIGAFIGLALEVIGFFLIIAKYHEN